MKISKKPVYPPYAQPLILLKTIFALSAYDTYKLQLNVARRSGLP